MHGWFVAQVLVLVVVILDDALILALFDCNSRLISSRGIEDVDAIGVHGGDIDGQVPISCSWEMFVCHFLIPG